jgi:hypothetical protein
MDTYSTASREGASADAGCVAIVASVRTVYRAASVTLTGLLVATAAVAAATTGIPKQTSPLLWATINVCDTAAHPNTIGIRGSMPGTGDAHEQMYMQFVVEYRSPTGHWHFRSGGGESRFVAVGNGSFSSRQAGWNFVLARSSTETYTLRGIVVFEWRVNGRAVAHLVRATRAGHRAAAGADPAGYSSATCTIKRKAAGRL